MKFSISLIFNLYQLAKERKAIYEKLLIDFGSGFFVINNVIQMLGIRERPIGKYIVELHPFHEDDKVLHLCMPCYTYHHKKQRKKAVLPKKRNTRFFSDITRLYDYVFSGKQNAPH